MIDRSKSPIVPAVETKTMDHHLPPNRRRPKHPTGVPIAVTGLWCRYPGANGPLELWENICARRREFRRIHDQRVPLGDYGSTDRSAPDKTYGTRAAYLTDFEFPWADLQIPEPTIRAADVVHWLALDTALSALQDAGYDRDNIPRSRAGVVIGNSLTGEQSRANSLRLRWPFMRRVLEKAGRDEGLADAQLARLLARTESLYKSVFPELTGDSLAGALSNTIAGRICNYLDVHGGGYSVDGACASGMLAVCDAATRLSAGDLDMAVAGGVDVSLDPFELVGFAKAGALAAGDMTVYDRRASGFLPGEGCGFVVLKRLADARRDGDYVYAVVRGWGVSSDGQGERGGLTAPSRAGQARAIRRAYARAGYGLDSVDFVEGHGTGTALGDRTELEALATSYPSEPNGALRPLGVTSLKSIIGHTKAAAGIGAFIKAVIAANRRVIPPTAGCAEPSPVFGYESP
jgi:acyl transferase domain-containing protein